MIEKLLSNLYQRLHISGPINVSSKILDSFDSEGIVKHLKKCKNVICMIGAGVSTCKKKHEYF